MVGSETGIGQLRGADPDAVRGTPLHPRSRRSPGVPDTGESVGWSPRSWR